MAGPFLSRLVILLSAILTLCLFLPGSACAYVQSTGTCVNITEPNGAWVLTSDITGWSSGNCFSVNVSNVTIDCAYHRVGGVDAAESAGIYMNGSEDDVLHNVTVKDCILSDWGYGLKLNYVNNSSVSNSSIG